MKSAASGTAKTPPLGNNDGGSARTRPEALYGQDSADRRARKRLQRAADAAAEVQLVRRVVLDYLRCVRKGGAGGFDTGAYQRAGELYEAPLAEARASDGI